MSFTELCNAFRTAMDDDLDREVSRSAPHQSAPGTYPLTEIASPPPARRGKRKGEALPRTEWTEDLTVALLDELLLLQEHGKQSEQKGFQFRHLRLVAQKLNASFPEVALHEKTIAYRVSALKYRWMKWLEHLRHVEWPGLPPQTDFETEEAHFETHPECERFRRQLPECYDLCLQLFGEHLTAPASKEPASAGAPLPLAFGKEVVAAATAASRPPAPFHTHTDDAENDAGDDLDINRDVEIVDAVLDGPDRTQSSVAAQASALSMRERRLASREASLRRRNQAKQARRLPRTHERIAPAGPIGHAVVHTPREYITAQALPTAQTPASVTTRAVSRLLRLPAFHALRDDQCNQLLDAMRQSHADVVVAQGMSDDRLTSYCDWILRDQQAQQLLVPQQLAQEDQFYR